MCVNLFDFGFFVVFGKPFFESLSKSKLCVKCSQLGSGSGFQAVSLAFIVPAQHSVHPTGGSRRVFKQFVWLKAGSVKVAFSRPTHPRVTHTVGRTNAFSRFVPWRVTEW